jgi:hypothetical protein
MNNNEIFNAKQSFFNKTQNLFSQKFQNKIESVCDAVSHNLYKTVPGFQISDKFLWDAVTDLKKNVIPNLNSELQQEWKIIEDFLYYCVGKDVEEYYRINSAVDDELAAFAKKHNLKTKFKLRNLKNGILDLTLDKHYSHLFYTEASGWGELGSVSLSQPLNYANLWIAAENLYINSKDVKSNVITNFIYHNNQLIVIFDVDDN